MKKAYILYKKADAEKNGVLINKYIFALRRHGLSGSLVIMDRLSDEEIFSHVSDAELVINRSRESGTVRYLEERGIRVSNPSVLNETANDKLLTYERLSAHVPMLDTYLLSDGVRLPFPFVAKPAGGHGGAGVTLVRDENDLLKYRAAHPEKSVVQPVASEVGRDMRVYVIGGRPVAAMLRVSDTDFRSNYSLGGKANFIPLTELRGDERSIVRTVSDLIPVDYAGVDIMRDKGRAVLNEIEDPVGARMLYTYTDIDPAELHIEYLISKE